MRVCATDRGRATFGRVAAVGIDADAEVGVVMSCGCMCAAEGATAPSLNAAHSTQSFARTVDSFRHQR